MAHLDSPLPVPPRGVASAGRSVPDPAGLAEDRLRLLLVIHGYPPRYNAGSEVYTQSLAAALSEQHEVHVFTRFEDPFLPTGHLAEEEDPDAPAVRLHLVNNPHHKDRYRDEAIDRRFEEILLRVRPHVVHVGHLNHLSTGIPLVARRHGVPVVFTLHDFWLACPRGQFLQMYPEPPAEPWALCDGQQHRKCASRCYARYFAGGPEDHLQDVQHWAEWVARRMRHVRQVVESVNLFVSPSRHLARRIQGDLGIGPDRMLHADYGFDVRRLEGRARRPESAFVFGYIGTHIPAKGIHHLLQAFGGIGGEAALRIWGRARPESTDSLKVLAAGLPEGHRARVHWMGEYRNPDIVREVLDRIDAIVVPSIWEENSPLVIHEALQARVPVVTADAGGMGEFVRHEVNGLLFRHRDPVSLAGQMQRLVDHPDLAARLGARGYLQSDDGNVVDMHRHARELERAYRELAGQEVRRACA